MPRELHAHIQGDIRLPLPAEIARADETDPDITQRVEQFIWKPAPGDLLLKPKPKKHPKPKDARN
ncbi:MAG TPA: hypothetical protein VFP29_07835 [Methyloceanibacter sp.]|nr:hypothetical protein [Methyloceanibacter sp.]